MTSLRFLTDIAQSAAGLERIRENTHRMLLDIGELEGQQMEEKAKAQAPWVDRTGDARRTIKGWAQEQDEDTVCIGLSGFMSYSPVLELGYEGRYAVLEPVVSDSLYEFADMIADAFAGI